MNKNMINVVFTYIFAMYCLFNSFSFTTKGKRLPKKTLVLNPNGKPHDEYWLCIHDTCLKFIN